MIRGSASKPSWPYTLNRRSSLSKGLAGWWPGGPSGGSRLLDCSGRGNHGAIVGTIPASGVWAPGYRGDKSALSFDASTNYVNTSIVNPTWFAGDFTVAMWIKVTLTGTNMILFDKRSASTSGFVFSVNGATSLLSAGNNGVGALFGSTAMVTGRWTLVGVTRRGTSMQFYQNGLPDGAAQTYSTDMSDTVAATIGGRSFTQPGFVANGLIEQALYSSRAWSASEMASFAANPWQLRYQPGRRLASGRALTATVTTGAFSETGNTAAIARRVSCATGVFAETGNAAGIRSSRTAAVGSFAENGNSVACARSRSADCGSFAETGNIAGIAKRIASAVGAFSLNGQGVEKSRQVSAASASYAETGAVALTDRSRRAAPGTFLLTGAAEGRVASRGDAQASSSLIQGAQVAWGFVQGAQASLSFIQGAQAASNF